VSRGRAGVLKERYQEAIAAYQAVLKRDPRNVDAMTHLALIVAMGGHADAALETLRSMAVSTSFLRNSTRPLGVR
jgi:cytochrome c-type biogenesis protein CcmH/NrfG